jgi:AcrR family transcriptional regulator
VPDIRTKQKAVARQAIVEGCAHLVNERRHLDFSLQEVANSAGVSLRTVYNHFADRKDLLDGLGHYFEKEMTQLGGIELDDISSIAEVPSVVLVNFRIFEELGGVSEAFAAMPIDQASANRERLRRTKRIRQLTTAGLPGVSHVAAEEIGVLIRHLISHRSWYSLTRDYGLSTDAAARHVGWAVTALLDRATTEPEGVKEEDR